MILLFLEKVQIDYTGIMFHMQGALYYPLNPTDFMRHDNNCIKSGIPRPVRARDICFGTAAQTRRLGTTDCAYTGGNIWAIFNLDKQQ